MEKLICPLCDTQLTNFGSYTCWNCGHGYEVWHVMPVNDEKPHEAENNCACKPTFKGYGANFIATHHSYDGREGLEWAKAVLGDSDKAFFEAYQKRLKEERAGILRILRNIIIYALIGGLAMAAAILF